MAVNVWRKIDYRKEIGKLEVRGEFLLQYFIFNNRYNNQINRETEALNNTIKQLDLTDICRTLNPATIEYTFFLSAHGTFSKIDHILGHKSSLGKFKKIEIISSIFSNYNAMRLEINYRKKAVKHTNTGRLNNMLPNNQQITEEIKEEIKKQQWKGHKNKTTEHHLSF